MERFGLLFVTLLILTFNNTYAQQTGNCTMNQMLEMARAGLSTPEINEKCGIGNDGGDGGTAAVLPERFVKVGETVAILDGAITLYLKSIGTNRRAVFILDIPRRKGKMLRQNNRGPWGLPIGGSYSFDYRRHLYKLHILDVFLDDQVAKITIQDVGPYTPK